MDGPKGMGTYLWVEVENIKEVRAYLDEAGADVSGMTDEDLEEACEVFTLPSGGYLIVEA